MKKKSTKSPWRKLASEGEYYPAIVENEDGYLPEETLNNMQVDPRYALAWENRGKYRQAPVEQELPQEVKVPPNSWSALAASAPEPTIFNQVSNTIRRRTWR